MAQQPGMRWYVLRAVSGKEAKVKEYLEALMKKDRLLEQNVGQVLLPTEKYAQLRNGKRVVSGVYMVETATEEGKKGVVCKIAIVR